MLIANAIWGIMSPVSKFVMQTSAISALALTTYRFIGATVLFWTVSAFLPRQRVDRADHPKLFLAALLAIVLNQGTFIAGISLTSPINASVITTTVPIIAMIISAIFLHEPITGKKVSGITIGLAGALLLVTNSGAVATAKHETSLVGDFLCLFSQFSFSFYLVLFKKLSGKYSPVTLMKWMFLYATICGVPFTYQDVLIVDYSALSANIYLGVAWVVVGGTFIGYFLIPIGQNYLRPTVVCMYNHIQPILSTIVSVYIGLDTFGLVKTAAVTLIFIGVYVVTQSKSKAQIELEKQNKTKKKDKLLELS